MGDGKAMRTFWQGYSDSPNIETMMLNKNAEEFDEQDRRDIWKSLPDLSGLRVVEIGSGIGRFTTALANKAKHVLATDFVDSFVEKNRELNSHLGNVSFQCVDASHLDLEAENCDLVFTNWLLMYLTDMEVVHFLKNVLTWLTPNGYLHFRESCSESSKRTPSKPNDPINPTRYRHISQYLTLLEKIRIHDEHSGKLMRFQVMWAKSVETYVRLPSEKVIPNWRQIHMLLRKVVANVGRALDDSMLVRELSEISIDQKNRYEKNMDTRLDAWNARSPLEPVLLKWLKSETSEMNVQKILNLSFHDAMAVSPFAIAEEMNCDVQDLNTCYTMYDYNLAQANAKGDQRLRFKFIPGLVSDPVDGWQYVPQHSFDVIIGCLLSNFCGKLDKMLAVLMDKLKPGGRIILLEKCDNPNGLLDMDAYCNGKKAILMDVKNVNDEIQGILKSTISQLENIPELKTIRNEYENWSTQNEKSTQWLIVTIRSG